MKAPLTSLLRDEKHSPPGVLPAGVIVCTSWIPHSAGVNTTELRRFLAQAQRNLASHTSSSFVSEHEGANKLFRLLDSLLEKGWLLQLFLVRESSRLSKKSNHVPLNELFLFGLGLDVCPCVR